MKRLKFRRTDKEQIKEQMDRIYSETETDDEVALEFARRAAQKLMKNVEWE